jgi:hypothetical protein
MLNFTLAAMEASPGEGEASQVARGMSELQMFMDHHWEKACRDP